ncbi:MAG: TetR family transcriptional regulator [Gammaproteobacteria bacterium]|nr:TetR family transcriptional regulator [Gammaproteobacteria bacterium]
MSIAVTEKNFASRNRKQQSEFRKRQLIDATIDCIDKLGLSQTTLSRIAERAGLSQSNVLFHFQSKEALLEQTLHHLNDEYQENWQQALAAAGDSSYEQLRAMARAAFAPQICNRKKISLWFAFWGESRSRPKYMKICGANDQAFSDKLLALCEATEKQHGARLSATTAALGIEGMIDGQWQNFLLGATGFKREGAIQAVFELIDSAYPGASSVES